MKRSEIEKIIIHEIPLIIKCKWKRNAREDSDDRGISLVRGKDEDIDDKQNKRISDNIKNSR